MLLYLTIFMHHSAAVPGLEAFLGDPSPQTLANVKYARLPDDAAHAVKVPEGFAGQRAPSHWPLAGTAGVYTDEIASVSRSSANSTQYVLRILALRLGHQRHTAYTCVSR
jgi:hypothetical protein